MSKIGTLTLTGASGNEYTFNVYPLSTEFKEIAAVYYISNRTERPDGGGSHSQIYVGQTGDLSERFDDHHDTQCFQNHSANCISVHQESSEDRRIQIEKDLIDSYDPPCNG